eukprot:TRINITY_DN81668_c0_g1_i1.p1 TRINITY_DN81668_c0_g1~~TRINITY_DN81668_c0_g1_i1.p1  ORF type:complete len:268 (+),score=51.90 TRINITY_DN81668_c0_g1_i1:86-889(+)
MEPMPCILVRVGNWECLCRNTHHADDEQTELKVDHRAGDRPVGGPTLLASGRTHSSTPGAPNMSSVAKQQNCRYSRIQEEPECEAEAGAGADCTDPSPALSRWWSATSAATAWSFAGSPPDEREDEDVDLSGEWILDRTEGAMEELLEEGSVSWAIRRMAAASGYGVGLVRQVILQEGDRISIEFKNLQSHTTEVRAGAGEQETLAEDGAPIIVQGRWEDSSFWLEGINKETRQPVHKSRRYLEGGEMVQETFLHRGSTARRIFRRA